MAAIVFASLAGGTVFAQDATPTTPATETVVEKTAEPTIEPAAPATAVPTVEAPTSTAAAPAATAPQATAAVTPAAAAKPANQRSNWLWALGIALLALYFLAYGKRWTKRPRPAVESCARCGFDMTGKTGPCPQCGSTRKLPKL
jgi:hypothetical protein